MITAHKHTTPLNVPASVATGRWESRLSSQYVNDSVLSRMFARGPSTFLFRSVIDETAFGAKLLKAEPVPNKPKLTIALVASLHDETLP